MGDVVRAVGLPKKANGHASIERRLSRVEIDVAALTQTQAANDKASRELHGMVTEVLKRLGAPKNGSAEPSTGLYYAMDEVRAEVNAVSARVKPFENIWLQVKGAVKVIAFTSVPVGVLLWFLAGDRLTALLHG